MISKVPRSKVVAAQQFVVFCCVGGVNTAVDFCLFLALVSFAGLNPLLANVISFSAGGLCSFLLNSRFTFAIGSGSDARPKRPLRFAIVVLATLALSTLVLKLASLALPLAVAKLVSIAASLAFGFPLNRTWVFGPAKERQA